MDYNIITPQFVKIRQDTASVGERIVARIIDYFIIFVWFSFWAYVARVTDTPTRAIHDLVVFLVIMPALLYTFLWETFNNGQTPGKRIMKIRVVRKDGRRPTIGNYFMRWLLEIVDIDFLCVGLISMLITRDSQRLGDLAAGTMVIKVDRPLDLGITLDDFSYAHRNYHPSYPQVENLTSGQISVISKATDRYITDDEAVRPLADKVAKKLGIKYDGSPLTFLLKVLHDYEYYATELI